MKRWPILSLLLAILHTSAGLLILIFSSWFIAACALMPVNFNYMLPAVIIRALALTRIGAGYGHMWLAHHDLLGRTTWLRSELFARLKNSYLPNRSGDVERLATQTETLSSIWVGWVAHQASGVVLTLLAVAIPSYLMLPGALAMWCMGLLWALITVWLVAYGLKKAQLQAQQEAEFRFASEHFFNSSSLWHIQLQEHQGRFVQPPDLNRVWQQHQAIDSAGQWALWLMHGAAIVLLMLLFILNEGVGLGEATSLIVPMLLLSITDWLGRPLTTAAHYGRYQQAKQAVMQNDAVALPRQAAGNAKDNITLEDFQASTMATGVSASLPASGLVLLSGPSGCGKSSLLKALAGLVDAKGQMLFDGNKATVGRRADWLYVDQSPQVLEATVRGNLILAGDVHQDDHLLSTLQQFGLAAMTDLDEWLGKGGRKLSGGEARRLSLARTALANPTVWLVDEPFEGLDEANQRSIAQALLTLSADRLVVVATHVIPDTLDINSIQHIEL